MALTRSATLIEAKPRALPGFEHINRYFDRGRNRYVAKILPGEVYVTRADEGIMTVLGSCVSACVCDRLARVGGMNHFMLPGASGGDAQWGASTVSAASRYGSYAMEFLINEVLKHGGHRARLEVKITGGGRILQQMTDVGLRNISFVRRYLEAESLRLVSADVGDTVPRKVLYLPGEGRLLVKRLGSLHNDTLLQRENDYRITLEESPVAGEVELFGPE